MEGCLYCSSAREPFGSNKIVERYGLQHMSIRNFLPVIFKSRESNCQWNINMKGKQGFLQYMGVHTQRNSSLGILNSILLRHNQDTISTEIFLA